MLMILVIIPTHLCCDAAFLFLKTKAQLSLGEADRTACACMSVASRYIEHIDNLLFTNIGSTTKKKEK